jgi:hypothetical protein
LSNFSQGTDIEYLILFSRLWKLYRNLLSLK